MVYSSCLIYYSSICSSIKCHIQHNTFWHVIVGKRCVFAPGRSNIWLYNSNKFRYSYACFRFVTLSYWFFTQRLQKCSPSSGVLLPMPLLEQISEGLYPSGHDDYNKCHYMISCDPAYVSAFSRPFSGAAWMSHSSPLTTLQLCS